MGESAKPFRIRLSRSIGFSMVELVVSMALVLILAAFAVPSLNRSYRVYQMNSSATRLAGIVKLARFEAIRRNTLLNLRIQQTGGDWTLWSDSDGNGAVDPAETQLLISGIPTLLPAGAVPNPAAITTALNVASLTTLSGVNGLVSFDSRGAVFVVGAQPPVYVLYLGVPNSPEFGYRAVVLLPAGTTQVWTNPGAGNWQRLS